MRKVFEPLMVVLVAGFAGGQGCNATAPEPEPAPVSGSSYVSVVPLVNDRFRIVEMATAHGAFALEVEVAAGVDLDVIAHELIDPVQDRYVEVLVYFYERDSNSRPPIARAQWTPLQGYALTKYDAPETR